MLLPLLVSGYIFFTAFAFFATNVVQEEPYMDEVAHIPQVQKYCEGNFSAVSTSLFSC